MAMRTWHSWHKKCGLACNVLVTAGFGGREMASTIVIVSHTVENYYVGLEMTRGCIRSVWENDS